MNMTTRGRHFWAVAVTLGLAACSGGSGSNQTSIPQPPAGGPTTVAVVGTITGFGSVYVNGVRYEVRTDTVVDIEGEPETMGDDSGLRLGMKVYVVASNSGGQRSADRIQHDDDLRGPIESIAPDANDPSIGGFTVLGQTVIVDSNTVFDDDVGDNDGVPGIDLRDLAVGMVVEVSGFPMDGGFLATRVDREFDGAGNDPDVGRPDVDDDELEIKGFVEAIAADGSSITVNGMVFLVDGGTFFDDGLMLNDELIGVFVEVKADVVGADYVAVEVEREDDFDDDNTATGSLRLRASCRTSIPRPRPTRSRSTASRFRLRTPHRWSAWWECGLKSKAGLAPTVCWYCAKPSRTPKTTSARKTWSHRWTSLRPASRHD